ncbi:transcriptional regulator [Candidatus Magnetomorum sp. HK-1]|nr:transcriptional regulator [Candidatus Magnetomorum sp. HK-1]
MAEYKIRSKNDVQYVEILLTDETVIVEAGLMHYFQGNISMENPMPGAKKMVKAKLSGEKVFRPCYKGTGKLILTPSLKDYFAIHLNDDAFIIDQGAFCAADSGVIVDISVNKAFTGMMSGEGLVQTLVKGTGTVIISVPGPVETIHLENDTLIVDGPFSVGRSQSLDFQTEKISSSIIKSMTSGEGWVNAIRGTGTVFLSPVPNKNILFQEHFDQAFSQFSKSNSVKGKDKSKFKLPGCLVNLLTLAAVLFFVYFLFIYYFSQWYK